MRPRSPERLSARWRLVFSPKREPTQPVKAAGTRAGSRFSSGYPGSRTENCLMGKRAYETFLIPRLVCLATLSAPFLTLPLARSVRPRSFRLGLSVSSPAAFLVRPLASSIFPLMSLPSSKLSLVPGALSAFAAMDDREPSGEAGGSGAADDERRLRARSRQGKRPARGPRPSHGRFARKGRVGRGVDRRRNVLRCLPRTLLCSRSSRFLGLRRLGHRHLSVSSSVYGSLTPHQSG